MKSIRQHCPGRIWFTVIIIDIRIIIAAWSHNSFSTQDSRAVLTPSIRAEPCSNWTKEYHSIILVMTSTVHCDCLHTMNQWFDVCGNDEHLAKRLNHTIGFVEMQNHARCSWILGIRIHTEDVKSATAKIEVSKLLVYQPVLLTGCNWTVDRCMVLIVVFPAIALIKWGGSIAFKSWTASAVLWLEFGTYEPRSAVIDNNKRISWANRAPHEIPNQPAGLETS